jgi:hypothetical protein
VTAHDDPRDIGGAAPTNRSADPAAVLRELSEALTALGNYLEAAQHQFERRQETFGEVLQASLGQYERAAECLRRLRHLIVRNSPESEDRSGSD